MVVAFITTVIFFVIVLSLRHTLKMKKVDQGPGRKGLIQNADIISLGALIVSIVVTGILPFLQNPLLDYTVTANSTTTRPSQNIQSNQQYNNNPIYHYIVITQPIQSNHKTATYIASIQIRNDGLVAAKNVIISMVHNTKDDYTFFPFESIPYLYSRLNDSGYKKGFVQIDNLPPRSETNLTTYFTTTSTTAPKIEPYVRSDAWVGYHDTIPTVVFYSILGTSYVGLFIYMVFGKEIISMVFSRDAYTYTATGLPQKRPIWASKFWEKYSDNWKHLKDRNILNIAKFLIGFTVYVGIFTILYLYHILIPSAFCNI